MTMIAKLTSTMLPSSECGRFAELTTTKKNRKDQPQNFLLSIRRWRTIKLLLSVC
jgi:hypothetical protein